MFMWKSKYSRDNSYMTRNGREEKSVECEENDRLQFFFEDERKFGNISQKCFLDN